VIPQGWDFETTDPNAMLRISIEKIGVLPTILLTYHKRPGEASTASPAVTIWTPTIPTGNEFRAIFEPGKANSVGYISFESQDGFVSSSPAMLSGTPSLGINVGSHSGRVKITWDKSPGDGEAQILRIACPTAAQYIGPRTWTPETIVKDADSLTVAVSFPKWALDVGSVKIDSVADVSNRPASWSIVSGTQTVVGVVSGMLISNFSTSAALPISSFVPPDEPGRYTIQWRPGQNLRIFGKGLPLPGVALPFRLDIPIPDAVLTSQLQLSLRSYAATEGSGRVRYVLFSPS
jgi:hypothetical protein